MKHLRVKDIWNSSIHALTCTFFHNIDLFSLHDARNALFYLWKCVGIVIESKLCVSFKLINWSNESLKSTWNYQIQCLTSEFVIDRETKKNAFATKSVMQFHNYSHTNQNPNLKSQNLLFMRNILNFHTNNIFYDCPLPLLCVHIICAVGWWAFFGLLLKCSFFCSLICFDVLNKKNEIPNGRRFFMLHIYIVMRIHLWLVGWLMSANGLFVLECVNVFVAYFTLMHVRWIGQLLGWSVGRSVHSSIKCTLL